MKRRPFFAGSPAWLQPTVAFLLLAASAAVPAVAAERVVLGEEFSATW